MRDDSYLESEIETESRASKWRSKAVTAFGAAASIVILVAVVAWSYRLGVQDATEIPVIRAELEATKERPEDPGGLEVAHQDRAVYGVVSGGAESGETALAPAPERLADEDVAPIAASPEPEPRPVEAAPGPAPVETAETPAETVSAEAAPAPAPVSEAAEPSPTADEIAAALAAAPADEEEAASAEPETVADAAEEASAAAPVRAPAAQPRPVRRVALATGASEAAEPRAEAAASTIQIQLGAFVTEEIAAEQWSAIKGRNGDLLAGRGRVVTTVQSGGRTLYRLRAGPFASVAEASALCRGLKARDEACIVARAR